MANWLAVLAVIGTSALGVDARVASSELVGVWQAAPVMASGWTDTYLFYEDGRFAFHRNQMDCENRDLGYFGTWSLSGPDHDTLSAHVERTEKLVGGILVRSYASCASEYMIEDGEVVMDTLEKPKTIVLVLSPPHYDDYYEKPAMRFGSRVFWRFSNEPTDYYQ